MVNKWDVAQEIFNRAARAGIKIEQVTIDGESFSDIQKILIAMGLATYEKDTFTYRGTKVYPGDIV